MNNTICRNCGLQFSGERCPQCGYDMNVSASFKNVIQDKTIKENIAMTALTVMAEKKLISLDKDLKNLVIEFGYLLVP